jgi:hypothetical protein
LCFGRRAWKTDGEKLSGEIDMQCRFFRTGEAEKVRHRIPEHLSRARSRKGSIASVRPALSTQRSALRVAVLDVSNPSSRWSTAPRTHVRTHLLFCQIVLAPSNTCSGC